MRSSLVTTGLIVAISIASITGCGSREKEENKNSVGTPKEIKITKGVVKKRENSQSKSKSNSGQFYYSYNKEKKDNDTEDGGEIRRRTTLDAYLNIRSPYERVMITMMIKKLSRNFIVKCSPCHDDYANGVIGPSLLDKNGTYIYKKITAFKSGEKKNVLMKQLVSRMSDDELKSIADEIAEFNKQIQKMRKGREQ